MDRATIERNLAQVERDLRAASEDIAHQRQTLRNLTRHGNDTTEAVRSKYEIGFDSIPASRLVEVAKALEVPPSFFFKGPRARARDPLYKRETLELVRAYLAIQNPTVRGSIAETIRAIAPARRGQPDHRRLSRRGRPSGA
jgi:transcriptional regulator with XRE-family HTH domain